MRAARCLTLGWLLLPACVELARPPVGAPASVREEAGLDGFPGERDLAIVVPLEGEPLWAAGDAAADGTVFLPEGWVDAVGSAFLPTVVGEGFLEESWYEDWRLVAVRVSPCTPLAPSPAVAPATVCWPTVRLVWQPVVGFVERGGVPLDAWADDRAIHAIYPVAPRNLDGARVDASALDAFRSALADGVPADRLPAEVASVRDDTLAWLLTRVASLRDPILVAEDYQGVGLRPELLGDRDMGDRFAQRLTELLEVTAPPSDLRELTAFSLPAGRQPSGDDAWVFVQFEGDGGELTRRRLEVVSRATGELLLDVGWDQDAGQTRDAPSVEAALVSDPGGELHETVVSSTADIGLVRDRLLNVEDVFVPNTTCATCHRLNALRFDFHALSSFEDQDPTVSPRVAADLAFERAWLDTWRER